MTDLDSLESVMGDETNPATEVVDQPEVETPEGEIEAEAPPAEETQPTDKPPSKEDDASESWTKRAVLDERRKRQAAEQRIAELEAKLNPDAAPQQPARPDVFEDQEGAFGYLQQQFDQRLVVDRINLSREMMIDKHDDYEEIESAFVDLAKADASLVAKMRAAPLPAKFVYEHVKKHQQMQEMQDVDGYRAKVEAEVRAKILAEMEAEGSTGKAPAPAPHPPQLVNRRSASNAPVAHESLEDILGQ